MHTKTRIITLPSMLKDLVRLRIIQMIIDFILVYISCLLAYFLRVGFIFSSDFPFSLFAFLAYLASSIWIGFLIFTKYYRIPPRSGSREWYDVALISVGGAVAVGFLIVSYFFPREILFSRLIGVYIFLFGFLFLYISRWIFLSILASRKKQEKKVYRTLIIGANRVAEKIIQAIESDPYAPSKIIGVIDPYGMTKTIEGSVVLGKLDKLETTCEKEKITAIIQCDAFEHTLNLISLCDEKNIKFQFDPALRGIFEKNLRIREVAGVTMISFVKRDFEKGSQQKLYRIFDWILRQVFDVD